MLRAGFGPLDAFVATGVYWGFLDFNSRQTAGMVSSISIMNLPSTLPLFFKLVRAGNLVTAFTSPDALTWTQVSDPATITGPQLYAGMALAGTLTQTAAAMFDTLEIVPAIAPDFYPVAPISIPAYANGNSGTAQVVPVGIQALGGFTGTVAFSVSGLLAGVTATFNPQTVTGAGQTYLSLTIPPGLAAGSYPIAITARASGPDSSGTISHIVGPVLNVDNSHFGGLPGWLATPIGSTDWPDAWIWL